MFEHLAAHDRIVVTGPQRSGTTITAQMIAADLGHRYVDEAEFSVYDVRAWRRVLVERNIVVQCPHMLKTIVDDPPPDVLAVLMRRSLADIHHSERRIGWAWEHMELAAFGLTEGDSAALKYQYWDANRPPNSIEVGYGSLGRHRAFVEQPKRATFHPKQTTR